MEKKARSAKSTILCGYPEVEYIFTGEWRKIELGSASRVARRNREVGEVPIYKNNSGLELLDMTQYIMIKPYRKARGSR